LPGQLSAAVLRSPHAHARILSIDVSAAEAMPGVHAVLSLRDRLDISWYEEKLPVFGEVLRFVGDEVAVVAAETPELAEDALRCIRVVYRPLPFVVDLNAALVPGAPLLYPDRTASLGNRVQEPETYARGDVERGLAEAAITIDETYTTQSVVHNALEAHATTAVWQGEELVLYESTQGIFAVRRSLAQKLGLPLHRVRVVTEHMGGGFGAKQAPWKQTLLAALLARRTRRPVQLVLDRKGESLAVGNRNATWQRVRLGAKADGQLTAIALEVVLGVGACTPEGEGSALSALYQHLYRCQNVRTEQLHVYTNTGPSAAFRAPGYVEAAFGLESAMDELAQRLQIDPLLLRRRNYTDRDQTKNRPYSSPQSLAECYDRADETFRWSARYKPKAHEPRSRGFGIAAHEWSAGSGNPPAYAWIRIDTDGSVDLWTGTQDIGTGTRTVLAQVAAEALGVPLRAIRHRLGDTAAGPFAPTSAGSFTVPTLAPAVQAAAHDARAQLLDAAGVLLGIDAKQLELSHGTMTAEGSTELELELSELAQRLAPHTILGHGAHHVIPADKTIRTFGVQCAEVDVDLETGEVTLLRIVSAPDCGRVINPKLARSQVIGGVTQGIGQCLLEERIVDTRIGVVLNPNLEDYHLPTVADVPPIVHAEVNRPDLYANPIGAKGLGELPIIPTSPAIANAVFDAIGVRVRDLPLTRERILCALAARGAS